MNWVCTYWLGHPSHALLHCTHSSSFMLWACRMPGWTTSASGVKAVPTHQQLCEPGLSQLVRKLQVSSSVGGRICVVKPCGFVVFRFGWGFLVLFSGAFFNACKLFKLCSCKSVSKSWQRELCERTSRTPSQGYDALQLMDHLHLCWIQDMSKSDTFSC